LSQAVTPELVHRLVSGSHAEGITALAVQAVITHDTWALLIAEDGTEFGDYFWTLPGGLVLPGEILTDALYRVVAPLGLCIDEVTGYLGHDDEDGDPVKRAFRFSLTVTDPGAICRWARHAHRWVDVDDVAEQLGAGSDSPNFTHDARTPIAELPLSEPLRAWARGIYPDEAGIELLIEHATFLGRRDFTDRFVQAEWRRDGQAEVASIDWIAALIALDSGELACSSGEARVLRFAASLGSGSPVNLADTTAGVDRRTGDMFSRAVLHANGIRPNTFA
jgi:hypothetical protein